MFISGMIDPGKFHKVMVPFPEPFFINLFECEMLFSIIFYSVSIYREVESN